MSKTQTEASKTTPQEANDALNALYLGQDAPVTLDEAFEIMSKADKSAMKDLSQTYFKFVEKGEYLFAVTGTEFIELDGEKVEVVAMLDKNKQQLINGDKVFVSAVKKLTTIPCFVKVAYLGDVKSGNGTYKNLKVYTYASNVAR